MAHSRIQVKKHHRAQMSAQQLLALRAFEALARRYVNTRVVAVYRCGSGNDTQRDWVGLFLFLHRTPIVEVRPDGAVILRTDGWHTATTKRRINKALDAFNSPRRLCQKDFEWLVYNWVNPEHEAFDFEEAMTVGHISPVGGFDIS